LLAPHQPELAERLARRLAKLPAQHTAAVLREGATGELTPLLREVIDLALAEELNDGGLLEEPEKPVAVQATFASPKVGENSAPKHRPGLSARQQVPSLPKEAQLPTTTLQARVATLQPELAMEICRHIELKGTSTMQRCMTSDLALQEHVEEALQQLFSEEAINAKAADGDAAALFSQGRGHMLHGRPEKQESQGPMIRSSVLRASNSPVVHASSRRSELGSRSEGSTWAPEASQSVPLASPWTTGTTVKASGSSEKGRRIWGLEEFLCELGLSEYEEKVLKWAKDMGAISLEELVENATDLGDAMGLKPLEQKRLERQGMQAMRQAQQVSQSQTPKAPLPSELPGSRLTR